MRRLCVLDFFMCILFDVKDILRQINRLQVAFIVHFDRVFALLPFGRSIYFNHRLSRLEHRTFIRFERHLLSHFFSYRGLDWTFGGNLILV